MKNKIFIMKSIRSKLIFWICVLFIFIGALIYIPLSKMLPRMVTSQVLRRDVEMAKHLSEGVSELLLLDDKIALSLHLRDNVNHLEDAQYLFVQDPEGNIISHTFDKGFPKGLLSFEVKTQNSYRIKEFLSSGRRMYDIAVPILQGEIGILHLGVSLESSKKDIATITKINYYVAIVILVGLGVGILIFLSIGLLFSNRIIQLKRFATRIGSSDLNAKMEIKSKDELGTLAETFNEMVLRLSEKIQEIKRLNTVEERNRIAFDLHDGCAQDLANIIKRLELCEKLFNIDSQRAFEELATLRKISRDTLNRTRQVIFDLNSPEENSFNLLGRLKNYIKDYQRQNHIKFKLNVSDFVEGVPSDRARLIFDIMVEAFTNIKKHRQAKNVEVSLAINNDNNLTATIKDDGKGFDSNSAFLINHSDGKLGLLIMRQRARLLGGRLQLNLNLDMGPRCLLPFL